MGHQQKRAAPRRARSGRPRAHLHRRAQRKFIARAEIASAVHAWTPAERQVYPGDSPAGVLLAQVEEWDPPVSMSAVLSQIDRAEGARADFDAGVVRITVNEYETAVAIAAG